MTLRRRIVEALGNEAAGLPPHVRQKMDERIQAAAKKNAAIDPEQYKQLEKGVEYLDLRELQDTIIKAAWQTFQSSFANKETLTTKFGQLADLRNGIRHSRSVDEITRKEGEAAILWFEQVLKR
jgi:hypothetical protein